MAVVKNTSAVVVIAALSAAMPLLALIGYLGDLPALVSSHPEYAAMSPLTAMSLLLLATAIVLTARGHERSGIGSAIASIAIATIPLIDNALYGEDVASPLVLTWLRSGIHGAARMSIGTSVAIIVTALSVIPPFRRHVHLSDWLCGGALFISGIALLGYAYSTLDLYNIPVFRTMALRSAMTIFLLSMASIVLRAENGLFAVMVSRNEAGITTRRQLLFTIAGPLIGWLVLQYYRDLHLGVGASLAIFVTITTVPLIWLILRDGRLLRDLHAMRRAREERSREHTREVEDQLSRQAAQLERQGAAQITLAETAQKHSDNRYRVLFQSIDAGFCIIELKFDEHGQASDYRFLEVNQAFEEQTGLKEAQGRWIRDMAPDHEQHWFDVYGEIAKTHMARRFDHPAESLGNRWYDVHAFPVDEPSLYRVGILFNDVTAQRRATEALQEANATLEARVAKALIESEKAQNALRQSQKMEAVGQLTGGLAHDFNNLLQGISGSLELLKSRIAQGRFDDAERLVAAAQSASRRASALTHRLLAFSRQQTLEPKPTDINRLVAGMEELIRRTVGTHIALENVAAGGIWTTLVDPSQLENALLNLCINARDAMPDGGRIVIETANKWLDVHAAGERDLATGQYVTLSVSDNGCGMSAEVIARAFDPFFTTKPLGLGTGLGLSMIYGFAKQSGGQVRIYSEVGQGTSVCLWLPRHHGEAVEGEAPAEWREPIKATNDETVLIVDDEPIVRMLIKDVLDELGYESIEAADGSEALKVLQSTTRIDLLITDVGLPGGINGRQVADAARGARPDLTVLFITGYAENAVLSHGHLPVGMHVLTKPFQMELLAGRIQELLLPTS